jgi:hypothetical protein
MSRKFLIYGIDRAGLDLPTKSLSVGDTTLEFELFKTSRRFNDYDGVILFQGTFERFERRAGVVESYLHHEYDRDELDKRKKEAELLVRQKGILCFLLVKPFIDRERGHSYEGSDLAKYHLSYSNFYRNNFGSRIAKLYVARDEFRQFLDLYGAASSHFHHYNKSIEWDVIASFNRQVCGMVINQHEYFVPSLVPDNRMDVLSDYFTKLILAIQATASKLDSSIPSWVSEYEFELEKEIRTKIESLDKDRNDLQSELARLEHFKGVLVWSSDRLVRGVANLLEKGFEFDTDAAEEFKEDLKILDGEGNPWCLCEVKGVNRGVKREHINQADSHRERSGFPQGFPAVLIANVSMGAEQSITDRDVPIAREQMRHAKNMDVLVLRTLDLLNLLGLLLSHQITLEKVKEIFTSSSGWLHVTETGWKIEDGSETH